MVPAELPHMRPPASAIGTIVRRVQLLLICQLVGFGAVARGQTFVPPQSLTIPSDVPAEIPSDVSPDVPDFAVDEMPTAAAVGDTADFMLTIRTDLLDEFVKRETVQSKDVATQVMEADVRGIQTTTTSVQLCSADCRDTARLNIISQGTVSSNTVGVTPQAKVATIGSHTFNITKPVFFDGDRFLTKPAYGSLQARQFPQSVNTMASGLPLFGPIGDRIAWSEVYRRMPISDAIVVRKVADDVIPQVNTSVDKNLADLNRNWRSLRKTLESLSGSDRISWRASSTANSFSISAQNMSLTSRSTKPAGLFAALAGPESLVVLLSQEGVNRWLGRLPLAGLTVSDSALQRLVQTLPEARSNSQALTDLLKQPYADSSEPLLFSVKFAEVEPLALRFEDGLVTVRLKFQVVPKAGAAGVMQLVSVRLGGEPEDDGMWSLGVKQISAEPASRNEQPDMYTNLMNNPAIASQLQPTRLPRTIDLRQFHPKIPLFRLYRIQSEGGHLRVSLRVPESDERDRQ